MATVALPALADEMFAAASSVLGTLVERPITVGEVQRSTSDISLRIVPDEIATVSDIPSLGFHVVVRYERSAFARVVALMLGADPDGEIDTMHLSMVSETLSQVSNGMAERVTEAAGGPSHGITSEVVTDPLSFPAPPFESYRCEIGIGDWATMLTIDFDGIARAKLVGKPAAPAPPAPASRPARAAAASAGQPVAFPSLTPTPIRTAPLGQANLDLVHDVPLQISAVLGQTALSLRDVVGLQAGSVFELDKLSTDPIDLYVNNILIARGEVVVVDDKFAVKISELNPSSDKT